MTHQVVTLDVLAAFELLAREATALVNEAKKVSFRAIAVESLEATIKLLNERAGPPGQRHYFIGVAPVFEPTARETAQALVEVAGQLKARATIVAVIVPTSAGAEWYIETAGSSIFEVMGLALQIQPVAESILRQGQGTLGA